MKILQITGLVLIIISLPYLMYSIKYRFMFGILMGGYMLGAGITILSLVK